MARYKPIRMPIEAYNSFDRKGKVIQEVLKRNGQKKIIKRTEVLNFYSQKPIYIYDDEVLNFFIRKKKKRGVSEA